MIKGIGLLGVGLGYCLLFNLLVPSGFKWAKESGLNILGSSGSTKEMIGLNEKIVIEVRRARYGPFGILPSSYRGKFKLDPIHNLFFFVWGLVGFKTIVLNEIGERILTKRGIL